jgi:hypothetical protein
MAEFTKRKIVLRVGMDAKKGGACSCSVHRGTTSDETLAEL